MAAKAVAAIAVAALTKTVLVGRDTMAVESPMPASIDAHALISESWNVNTRRLGQVAASHSIGLLVPAGFHPDDGFLT
jgi:hypothetical protein